MDALINDATLKPPSTHVRTAQNAHRELRLLWHHNVAKHLHAGVIRIGHAVGEPLVCWGPLGFVLCQLCLFLLPNFWQKKTAVETARRSV